MRSSIPLRRDREDYDDIDEAILLERVAQRSAIPGPRVGDYCILLNSDVRRFTHHHGDRIQTTIAGETGSFYIAPNGTLDYSGSLDRAIPVTSLAPRTEVREGRVWWFSHNLRRAHNGVTALIPCRVYEEVAR
jgi:hypothetical protein